MRKILLLVTMIALLSSCASKQSQQGSPAPAPMPAALQGQPRFPDILDEGVNISLFGYRQINMVGSSVECVYSLGTITCTHSAAGGGGGHEIQTAGTPVTDRAALNFLAPFAVADNSGNDSSDVSLPISSLTNEASPADGDNFLFQQVSGGAFRRITKAQLASLFGGGFGETSLAGLANNQTLWDGASASRTLTIGLSGATDPVFTFGNNSVALNTPFSVQGLEFDEQSAPGAGSTSGRHTFYFDLADSLLKSHENGGSVVTYMGLTLVQSPTNKTINSGIATTTHAAGANILQSLRHATDCTAITDGLDGEVCYEKDADTLYVCEPTAGGCDTAGEWVQITSGGSGNMNQAVANDTDNAIPVAVGTSGTNFEKTPATIDPVTGDLATPGQGSFGSGTFNISRWSPPCYTLFDDAADLTATMDIPSLFVFMSDFGVQLDKVYCETDANTASINLQRDDGTPANVLGASLVCTTTGTASCADSGIEILSEPDFTTTALWAVAGDFAVGSGVATWTHSTGSGTLTQTEANQASAAAGNIYYRFDYTVASFTGDGACTITTGFAASSTNLTIANGAQSTRFLAAANPGDFVISCTSASGGFTLDSFALEAAPCVVDTISLAEDNFSKPVPTSNQFGDKLDLVMAAIDAGVRRVNVCVSGVRE